MKNLNSLSIRIFAIFWLTLSIVLMGVLYLPQLDSRQLKSLDSQEAMELGMFQKQLQQVFDYYAGESDDIKWLWQQLLSKPLIPGQHMAVVTPEGYMLGVFPPEFRNMRNFVGLSDNPERPKKKKYEHVELVGPIEIKNGTESYLIYLYHPVRDDQPELANLLFDRPLFLLIATMLISTPFLLWLSWSLAKPARKLKAAADNVANGKLETQPELESGPIEFRGVGISFNRMVNALNSMVLAQKRLISDISHELRSPLTRLQLAAAIQRRKSGDNAELQRIENEASRLESMINELLLLSRNHFNNEIEQEIISADQLWQDILDDALFEAEQIHKKLEIKTPPKDWKIKGNIQALRSALENIIRNALRYSNHYILIDFQQIDEGIYILVDDDGPGVEYFELQEIFRPFYRTDTARARSSGGSGLGLAIVQSAISQHGGHVHAERSPLKGLRLVLWLPLYK